MDDAIKAQVAELLVATGAYRDLPEPVILASGQLGVFYINTEKVLQDGGEFKQFGNSSIDMAGHVLYVLKNNTDYAWLCEQLEEDVLRANDYFCHEPETIAGGQTRDWLFSMPLAKGLGLHHVSLYKEPGKQEAGLEVITNFDGVIAHYRTDNIRGCGIFHQVDLVTEGSSIYHKNPEGVEKGWVPQLHSHGGKVMHVGAVVDRLQGAEQMLEGLGIKLHSAVRIDADFLDRHSKDPRRAKDYLSDPQNWSEGYIAMRGVKPFVDDFNPENGKLQRAARFLDRFQPVLHRTRRDVELRNLVKDKYHVDIYTITEGKA